MSEASQHGSQRFVPSGVDAQSWIGFEKRIQDRRFRALLESIQAAVARGDGVSARIALEEARELRPDSKELDEAAARLALLPIVLPAVESGRYFGSRTFSAVGLLLVGVALLVTLDFMRPAQPVEPLPLAAPAPSDEATLELRSVAVDPRPSDGLTADATISESVLPETGANQDAIGTMGGVRPVADVARESSPAPVAPRPTLQPAIFVERSRPAPEPSLEARSSGGVPDDFGAPLPRREMVVPIPPPPQPNRGTASAVARPPVVEPAETPARDVVTLPPPPAAAAAAAPVAAPAAARMDESRVALVLDRYAQAYASLDANAAAQVWPTVNERALAKAFAGLESQRVSFEDCSIDVHGETADASCRGNHSWLGKIGARETRTEPRQWRFELRRDGDAWRIESARTLQ